MTRGRPPGTRGGGGAGLIQASLDDFVSAEELLEEGRRLVRVERAAPRVPAAGGRP